MAVLCLLNARHLLLVVCADDPRPRHCIHCLGPPENQIMMPTALSDAADR